MDSLVALLIGPAAAVGLKAAGVMGRALGVLMTSGLKAPAWSMLLLLLLSSTCRRRRKGKNSSEAWICIFEKV